MSTSKAKKHRDRVRELNDNLRVNLLGGQWVLTAGIAALDNAIALKIIQAVRSFESFTPDNDPYEEHDFGAVEVDGVSVFWKIDYYDQHRQAASSDPSDETQTCRVLAVMLADEY